MSNEVHDPRVDQLTQELNKHIVTCDTRFELQNLQLSELIICTRNNTDAVSRLVNETHGVVTLHKDLQTAARIGVNTQKFLAWVIKWPLIGAGLYAAYGWLVTNLPK